MQTVFTIDGKSYNVSVTDLQRKASVLDGENAGRVMSGLMVRDIIGTYYNYSMTLDTRSLDFADYDALYELLTAPVDCHSITVPYGQGTATFDAYISNADDVLKRMDGSRNLWGDLQINFCGNGSQEVPHMRNKIEYAGRVFSDEVGAAYHLTSGDCLLSLAAMSDSLAADALELT